MGNHINTSEENPSVQTDKNSVKKGAASSAIGCMLLVIIFPFFLLYITIAEEVQWETTRNKYYGEWIVESVESQSEEISTSVLWFSDKVQAHASKVKVYKGELPKEMAALYFSPKQLKYFKKGQKIKGSLRPLRCATWADFFKIGYNCYDYRMLDVYAYTDTNGKWHILKKNKLAPDNSYIEWIIAGIVILIIILNSMIGSITFPKLKEDQKDWKYNVPSWLEWVRIIVLLAPSAFYGVHLYELSVAGTFSENWMSIIALGLFNMIPLSMAYSIFSKRNNYLQISAEKIEYRIGTMTKEIKLSEFNRMEIIPEYQRDTIIDREFKFYQGEEKVSFKCEDLGMKSNEDKIYKVVIHFISKGNIQVDDQTNKQASES